MLPFAPSESLPRALERLGCGRGWLPDFSQFSSVSQSVSQFSQSVQLVWRPPPLPAAVPKHLILGIAIRRHKMQREWDLIGLTHANKLFASIRTVRIPPPSPRKAGMRPRLAARFQSVQFSQSVSQSVQSVSSVGLAPPPPPGGRPKAFNPRNRHPAS